MPALLAEYIDYDACDLAELVAQKQVTPQELLATASAALERLDGQLSTVVHRHFDVAEATLQAGLPQGPLRGVPFLLKDLHVALAGTTTTHGSRLFQDHRPSYDSEIVRRYKRAGLVIFGKTHSSELGVAPSSESALFGQTKNPWNPAHSAGGSSGGSAAAVAAGIVPCAQASDGGGSIRIPAACCGIFGIKPSRGRTPMGPNVGEGWGGMSAIHVVSRSVRDSAALLDATHGTESGAPYAAPPAPTSFLHGLTQPPARLRIGLQTEAFNGAPTHPDCRAAAEHAARLCESLGHAVEPVSVPIEPATLRQATTQIITANVRHFLHSRANQLGRKLEAGDVENGTWIMAEMGSQVSGCDYLGAVQTLHQIGRQMARLMDDYDVLLTPTLATPPLPLGRLSLQVTDVGAYLADVNQTIGYAQLFNATGQPAASLPLYRNAQGLPIGVQIAGRFGEETLLLRLAAQLEAEQPWSNNRPPLQTNT